MICKKCGAVISEGGAFCPACGTAQEQAPQSTHCAKCGAALANGAAFCPACGTPRGAVFSAAQAPVSAPVKATKRTAPPMDKKTRWLYRVAWLCMALGCLSKLTAPSEYDGSMSIYEYSNAVTTHNIITLLLLLVGVVLEVVAWRNQKKNQGQKNNQDQT